MTIVCTASGVIFWSMGGRTFEVDTGKAQASNLDLRGAVILQILGCPPFAGDKNMENRHPTENGGATKNHSKCHSIVLIC